MTTRLLLAAMVMSFSLRFVVDPQGYNNDNVVATNVLVAPKHTGAFSNMVSTNLPQQQPWSQRHLGGSITCGRILVQILHTSIWGTTNIPEAQRIVERFNKSHFA